MCTADVRTGLRDIGKSLDPTNPNSDLRLMFVESEDAEFTDTNGKTYHGAEAVKHQYNANKAQAEAAAQEKETIAARAAYQTQFDSISADARGIRQRYAQSLGYNPYFLR